MPALLLIRHGQASFGEDDYDVLSPLGERQAEALGARLASVGLDVLVHGELVRQRATAEIVARRADIEAVEVDTRWDEYDHEDLVSVAAAAGELDEELARMRDEEADRSRAFQLVLETALRRWTRGAPGDYAETWDAFEERCTAAADELLDRLGSSRSAAVVTSGGVIAAICAGVLDAGPTAWLRLNRVMVNSSITRVVRGRRGTSVVVINDHAHLEGHDGMLTYR